MNRRSGLTRRSLLRLTAAAGGGFVLASCTGQSSPPASGTTLPGPSAAASTTAPATVKPGGTLKYAILRDPVHFDPHLSSGSSSLSLQGVVYNSLVEWDDKGEITGALAESWENPDPLTWVFHLRRGVEFHDGSTFDAEDVVASFNRIKDPKTSAPLRSFVAAFTKVETPDPFTVRISLARPNVALLENFVCDANRSLYIASADDVKNGVAFRTKTNGTGPFVLTSWEPGGQYVLKKNPRYWKKGLPYLNELIEVVVPNDKARVSALQSGEVDFAESLPWQEWQSLKQGGFDVYEFSALWNMIRINGSTPPLDDKRVRQALNHVIDRNQVIQLSFGGHGRPIDGPLQVPDSPYYWKDLEGRYKKDWDKARALLAEAGYNAPSDVPALEYIAFGSPVLTDPAQVILQQLTDFGLRVTFKKVDTAAALALRINGKYQLMSDGKGFGGPDPDNLRSFFASDANEPAFVNSARLNELLAQGVVTSSVEQRKKIYHDAESIIADFAPWIFVCWRNSGEAAAHYVKNYLVVPKGLGPQNVRRWEKIWLDK